MIDKDVERLQMGLDDIRNIVCEAVCTDGAHHKQWYLEEIALILGVDLPEHEDGIAP